MILPVMVLLAIAYPRISPLAGLFTQFLEPYGFINRDGKITIDMRLARPCTKGREGELRFCDGMCLSGELSSLANSEGKKNNLTNFYYMDRTGGFLLNKKLFVDAHEFSEGAAGVSEGKGWYFIDKSGKIKFPKSFSDVQKFSCKLAGVKLRGDTKWVFVNHLGAVAISKRFDAVMPFSEDRASVCLNGKWGLIDTLGNQVLAPTYENSISQFHDSVAAVYDPEHHRVDYLSHDGELLFSNYRSEEAAEEFLFGYIGYPQLLSESGWVEIPELDASEGLIVFEQNGKYGYCDLRGKVVIKPAYSHCWPFSDGRAICQQTRGGKLGYIDHSGDLVIPCNYEIAEQFSDGYALVSPFQNQRIQFINLSGHYVFADKNYAWPSPFREGLAFVGKSAKILP